MFSRKVFAITNLLGLSAAVLFKNQGAGGGPAFVYKRSEAIGREKISRVRPKEIR